MAGTGGPSDGGQPERIVAAVLRGLGRMESLSASLRQRVRVGSRVLVGAGRYVQQGTGEDQRFRFESLLQCDTESFETLEVCDGVFLWRYSRLGSKPPQLERIDLRRVREKLEAQGAAVDGPLTPHLGGLQGCLALNRQWFAFDTASTTQLADVPVWSIEGHWIPAPLAVILPELQTAVLAPGGIPPEQLPDGMPWSIRVAAGVRELIPFRIEWLAIPGTRPVSAAKPPEPVAVLELYDVQIGGPVDTTAFLYRPATEGMLDTTDTFLLGVGPLRP